MKTLSIIVPVYNEENTVVEVLRRLLKLKLKMMKEIIIIDDGSKDKSVSIINDYIKKVNQKNTKIIFITKNNEGKGSAVKKGIKISKGDIITIQDADLEYNPEDYKRLVIPILEGKAKVVYGSRFLKKHIPKYKIYFFGNKFLSLLTKILYSAKITDMETCYKVFHKTVIKKLKLKSNRFDIEPEITAKILKLGIPISEVPISYIPRSIEEGKKINWRDGLQAIWSLIYWKIKK